MVRKERLLIAVSIVTKQNTAIICQDRLGTHIVLKQLAFPQDYGCRIYTGRDAGRANTAEGKRPPAHTRRTQRVTQRVPPSAPFNSFEFFKRTSKDRWQQQFYAQKLNRCFFGTENCCTHSSRYHYVLFNNGRSFAESVNVSFQMSNRCETRSGRLTFVPFFR